MKALLAALFILSSPLLLQAMDRPYALEGLSGTASLIRYEELWPLEVGERVPADFVLRLQEGAWIHFRIHDRIDFFASGPAEFRSIAVDPAEEKAEAGGLALKLGRGSYLFDTRFLLDHPSQVHIDLPDRNFQLLGASRTALSVDASEQSILGQTNPLLSSLDAAPLPCLLMVRDYDEELKRWARPEILAPTLLKDLKPLDGLMWIAGSGERKLALKNNGALRSGNDAYLTTLARQRGARFLVTGNLVSQQIFEGPGDSKPFVAAVAEVRVLETAAGGEVLINDVANSSVARAARSLEILDRRTMHAAADRMGSYMFDDLQDLLLGESHPPILLKLSFNGVKSEWQHELRQGLGSLPSVQRYFRRAFSNRIFRLDVILRKSQDDFAAQLKAYPFEDFFLEPEKDPLGHGLAYTLRAKTAKP